LLSDVINHFYVSNRVEVQSLFCFRDVKPVSLLAVPPGLLRTEEGLEAEEAAGRWLWDLGLILPVPACVIIIRPTVRQTSTSRCCKQ